MLTYDNCPWPNLAHVDRRRAGAILVRRGVRQHHPATQEVIGVTADGPPTIFGGRSSRRAFELVGATPLSVRNASPSSRGLWSAHKIRPLLVREVGTCVWRPATLCSICRSSGSGIMPVSRLDIPTTEELTDVDFAVLSGKRRICREPMGVAELSRSGPRARGSARSGPSWPPAAPSSSYLTRLGWRRSWASWSPRRPTSHPGSSMSSPPGTISPAKCSPPIRASTWWPSPGSAPNGRRIAAVASDNLKRLLLVGGKSPYVVLESADVAWYWAEAARLICNNAGQGCVARSRLLIPRSRYEEGVEAAREMMASLNYGDPADPENSMGPLISRHHRERVLLSYIERAHADGNRLVHGGRIPSKPPWKAISSSRLLSRREAGRHDRAGGDFGPVIPYEDEADALAISANNSIYGRWCPRRRRPTRKPMGNDQAPDGTNGASTAGCGCTGRAVRRLQAERDRKAIWPGRL